jgi:hypothetical protein
MITSKILLPAMRNFFQVDPKEYRCVFNPGNV